MTEIEYWIDDNQPFTPAEFVEKHRLAEKSRQQNRVFLRAELVRLMHKKTTMTWSEMGRILNRDHATIIHAHNSALFMRKKKYKGFVELIEEYKPDFDRIVFDRGVREKRIKLK